MINSSRHISLTAAKISSLARVARMLAFSHHGLYNSLYLLSGFARTKITSDNRCVIPGGIELAQPNQCKIIPQFGDAGFISIFPSRIFPEEL